MRVVFLLILFVLPFCGTSTTISCSNADYAGKTLTFYSPVDPISNEKEVAFVLTFDAAGKSEANISIKGTVFTFCDFGIYRGMLMLEARKNHELKLPPFRDKSFADKKNPYFKPVKFWVLTENGNMLTDKISEFEQQLNKLTDKNFDNLYFRQSKVAFDSLQIQINKAFPENTPQAFVYHKQHQLKLIETDVFRLKPENYTGIFNGMAPMYWNHKAFVDLFNKAFNDQLSFLATGDDGKEISQIIYSEDVVAFVQFVSETYKLSGKISELVSLKLLYDGYYSAYFSKKSIRNMISSDFFRKNTNSVINKAAKNIINKFIFLEKKSKAPVICLKNLNGEEVCTNKNTDKFKYIVFADEEMIVCQEHLKYLSRINELFGKYLEIFVVLRNTNRDGIDKFFSENKIPGTITIDVENKYIEQYKVKSFPRCVLLDEKHNVISKEAKAPLNGFEQDFGTWLRNELFMRQRNQSK